MWSGLTFLLVVLVILLVVILPGLVWGVWHAWQKAKIMTTASEAAVTPATEKNLAMKQQAVATITPLLNLLDTSPVTPLLDASSTMLENPPRQTDLFAAPSAKLYIMAHPPANFMGYELWQALHNNGFILTENHTFIRYNHEQQPLYYLTFYPAFDTQWRDKPGAWQTPGLQLYARDSATVDSQLWQIAQQLAEELTGLVKEHP